MSPSTVSMDASRMDIDTAQPTAVALSYTSKSSWTSKVNSILYASPIYAPLNGMLPHAPSHVHARFDFISTGAWEDATSAHGLKADVIEAWKRRRKKMLEILHQRYYRRPQRYYRQGHQLAVLPVRLPAYYRWRTCQLAVLPSTTFIGTTAKEPAVLPPRLKSCANRHVTATPPKNDLAGTTAGPSGSTAHAGLRALFGPWAMYPSSNLPLRG